MKRLLISMTILALLIVPQFALGSDVDDLKAADLKLIEAVTSLNAEALASLMYPGAVIYDTNEAFPLVMPMENTQVFVTQIVKDFFNSLEYLDMYHYNPQYRVVGNIGLVWGHDTVSVKEKGEPALREHSRFTDIWIKSDGKWYMIMSHSSAIPSGD